MQKAVFFDRDGVINLDKGYVYQQENFEFCAGIFDLLRYFKSQGYLLLVITNQSGIARGYYSVEDFLNLTQYMQGELQKTLGFGFDKVYFCPHLEGCNCRKPKIGMISQACEDFAINLQESILIGDKLSDIQAAQNAKIEKKYLVASQMASLQGISNLYCVSHLEDIKKIEQREKSK